MYKILYIPVFFVYLRMLSTRCACPKILQASPKGTLHVLYIASQISKLCFCLSFVIAYVNVNVNFTYDFKAGFVLRILTASSKKFLVAATCAVFSLSMVFSLSPISAYGVTEAEVAQAKSKFQAAQSAAEEAAQKYYGALDAHDAAVAAMQTAQQTIEQTTKELSVKQDRLSDRAVSMYRSGTLSMFDVVFGTSSFSEFATTWDLLNKLNESDANLISSVKSLKEEQQAAYEEYSNQEKESATQLAAAETAKADAEAKSSELSSYYNSLSSELQAQVTAAAAASQQVASNDSGDSNNGGGGGGGNSSSNSGSSSSSGGSGGGGYVNNGGSGVCDVSLALAQVGKAYDSGATGPDAFDCSGLCYYCGAPYRSSASLYSGATSRLPVSEAQAGDVLWTSGHVGISLGGNDYVHASDYGIGVIVSHNASSAFSYVLRF